LPFEKERLETSGLEEFKRIIREEEPPRPSTRLSTGNATLDTVVENHGTDFRTLAQELTGELDWVVMKVLIRNQHTRGTVSMTDNILERRYRCGYA
jgi:hypothetical protein